MARNQVTSTVPKPTPTLPRDFDPLALAATVHTYDSFGRAIIESALREAARMQSSGGVITSTVEVRPAGRSNTQGGGAAGKATPSHAGCISIMIAVGDGPAHFYQICSPF